MNRPWGHASASRWICTCIQNSMDVVWGPTRMRRVSPVALVLLLAILTDRQPALAQSPAAAEPHAPTVTSVFSDLGRDFRHLVSRDSAVILGVAGLASLAVKSEDAAITRHAFRSQPLETVL